MDSLWWSRRWIACGGVEDGSVMVWKAISFPGGVELDLLNHLPWTLFLFYWCQPCVLEWDESQTKEMTGLGFDLGFFCFINIPIVPPFPPPLTRQFHLGRTKRSEGRPLSLLENWKVWRRGGYGDGTSK